VSPDLLSRQKAQQIFKDIVNEEDGEHISDSAILTEEERIGLKYEQFLEFISIVAVQCTWFVKSKKKKGGVAKTNVAGEDEGGELAMARQQQRQAQDQQNQRPGDHPDVPVRERRKEH